MEARRGARSGSVVVSVPGPIGRQRLVVIDLDDGNDASIDQIYHVDVDWDRETESAGRLSQSGHLNVVVVQSDRNAEIVARMMKRGCGLLDVDYCVDSQFTLRLLRCRLTRSTFQSRNHPSPGGYDVLRIGFRFDSVEFVRAESSDA